ncbi:PEP/pyruvate-binding domain-containing protein [Breznakiella homolactica]|uniref:Phosphoenolpyruvate synthase n=1 Tax=Breznakiella homolactica TaxID=2798577 RepID=A0A7T7XPU0_9SPIR|nr:PEP/pyruvate-binding domain-containing protein [Breznakiella homolactica]QQO10275.1 hypothetical protein JFL75_04970 [Breznakiella homolactica]
MEIYKLSELTQEIYPRAGGKARGLAELIRAKLTVADGFVITDLETEEDFRDAAGYYDTSGLGIVAVRSSASSEDGEDFSNAGQYTSYLNVSGREGFIAALKGCMASLHNRNAESYSAFFSQAKSVTMAVVVQKMVDAVCAGVCFTVDPATGKKDLLIEAVAGLGESLVSGQAQAERCIVPLDRENKRALPEKADYSSAGGILTEAIVSAISGDICRALDYFGHELDMEWAVDKDGALTWLQARPVTTLDEAAIDELDGTTYGDETTVYTNCNIGEMLPGAVTPLSLSTSVKGIDHGLRMMLIKAGAYRNLKEIRDGECITSYSNHLFFNLTSIYKMATTILGAQKESVEASICGKTLDTPPLPWKDKPVIVKAYNGIKYFKFLFSNKKAIKKIDRFTARMAIPHSNDLGKYYKNIDAAMPDLIDATYYHYITSAHSGAMSSAILAIIKGDYSGEDEAKGVIAGFLEDIDNIESVDILRSMRTLAFRVLKKNPGAVHYSADKLAEYIKGDTGSVREAYDYFIKRHGHRSIREAELRNKSWKNDETALMENIKTVMMSGAVETPKKESHVRERINAFLADKKGSMGKALGFLINQARQGVYNREYTKSKFVMAVDVFKEAYYRLAGMMVEAGALPERDLIYFLSHKEIGELIFQRRAKLIKKAIQRRRLLDEQMEVQFEEYYVGRPVPVAVESVQTENGMVLSGAPISRGETKGQARVVKSVEDARELQEGEIMVAAFTDIGWSPYYCIVGGLVTEVGSALSHGAVVAREYSLPLVANVSNATKIIKTGDLISINGTKGTVTILETAESYGTAAV